MEIKTSEFFKNIKKLPPPGSAEFDQLIKWEEEKILGGVNVNGVHISGWLYWHLNHWWIRIDDKDKYGNEIRVECLPQLRDNEWMRAEYLERCRVEKKGYMEIGARQGGKDLLDSSILYTPDGEVQIGDCQIGQKIYDDQGKLTIITGKYPQGVKPVYEITLVDGRKVYCGLDHNWYVYYRDKKKYQIKTTRELLEGYKRKRSDWSNRKNQYELKYQLPVNKAVDYPERQLEIPPYLLGLWLGDGSNTYSKITTIDDEIIDYLRSFCKENKLELKKDGEVTYIITSGLNGGSGDYRTDKNPVHKFLKNSDLYNNKHIPSQFLRSSYTQRLEILQGLMDSDGSCSHKGAIEFSTTDLKLANDFEFLCRSLGIIVIRSEKKSSYKKDGERIECKNSHRFKLSTDLPVFKLSRKLERISRKPKYESHVGILNIEYVFDASTTCITVDNNSHLFLTDGFTVTHNSETEASFFGMNAIMFESTQNVIVCGNDNDLSLLKDKVDFGLKKLWKGISIPRLDKTWRSNQVRLGYKVTNGDDIVWSYIVIRNAKDGHNTEVAAGTTAKSFIMDEVGKYPFSQAYEAAVPALKGSNGFRAIPMLIGTGGSFNNGKDAENFFNNPRANNFLEIVNEKGEETCIFLSGLYRQDCKYETNLADYLINEKGIKLEKDSELRKIAIKVSDKELAKKTILAEREAKKKNPDKTIYLKQVMYFPLNTEECFLSDKPNIYDADAARRQKHRLDSTGLSGTPVFLKHNNEGKIVHEFTDKLPISNFPMKPHESKDAPIMIYEFPMENPPYGLYVAGVDPYRQGKSEYSTSLGSVHIYKRMNEITGETYQNMFVASYTARPDNKGKWEEQARLLIKYYNARTLCENDEMSFIDYMIGKGDSHYLEKQPQWLKEIVPNTTVMRDFGIHRSAGKVRDFLNTQLKKYSEEKIYEEKDEEGSTTMELFGMSRIPDPMLLEEMAQFNEDDNFDRIISAQLAIALANKLDPIYGAVKDDASRTAKSVYGAKRVKNKLFSSGDGSSGLFKGRNKLNTLFK